MNQKTTYNANPVQITAAHLYCGAPAPNGFAVIEKNESGGFQVNLIGTNKQRWHSCRETFGSQLVNSTGRYIAFYPKTFNHKFNVPYFFKRIEKQLGLEEFTEFQEAFYTAAGAPQVNNLLVVKLSPFWLENYAKQQLLTIMLRVAGEYNHSQDAALEAIEYAAKTKKEIDKFLNKNTTYTKEQCVAMTNAGGWYSYFSKY